MREGNTNFLVIVVGVFLALNVLSINFSYALSCLPTCSSADGRFLAFGGQDVATFVYDTLTIGVGSPSGADKLMLGIFDGDTSGHWDFLDELPLPLEFTLIADPKGDLSGTVEVGKWFNDGSGGNNPGNPMPDNDWFNINIDNVAEAKSESGNFLYYLLIRNLNIETRILTYFKLRTDGTLFIFPTDQPFAYEASLRVENADFLVSTADILYPNIDLTDPSCINMGDYCDPNEPSCCLFGTTYDGTFSFFFTLENAQDVLNFWDGDFDFGVKTPDESPPFEDTDDPNTPPGIPPFADIPNTNPQGSAGAFPPDDSNLGIFRRVPNNFYEIISPNGTVYTNNNPSGSNEWELFQLSTEENCAPNICDIEVQEIPAGIWEFRINGLDLSNLNYIRGFEKIIGVDEEGDPVSPLPPDPPNPIPSLSGTGLVLFSVFIFIISVYYLRLRKNKHC